MKPFAFAGFLLSSLVMVACQPPISQTVSRPLSTASPTPQPSTIPTSTPSPSAPIPSPSPVATPSPAPILSADVILPLRISMQTCGQTTSETEIRADGLLIQRSIPPAKELFKGAVVERRVVLTPDQQQTLKSELKKMVSPATQLTSASCDPIKDVPQYQNQWQVSRADGKQETWLTINTYQLDLQKLLRTLAHDAPPDTTPNTYSAPFWTVIAGECSSPRINFALNQENMLQGSNATQSNAPPVATRQLTTTEAQQLIAKLQAIDPVNAYNRLVPPLGPVSDIALCMKDIEALVMTVNGELRAVPFNYSRLYAENKSELSAYLTSLYGFRSDLLAAL